MTGFAVLRPEPGNSRTAARLRDAGATDILQLPLFGVHAVAWTAPPASEFDGLVLTSANAVRHGGPALATLAALPVIAVGDATAHAAREAGFTVALTGDRNAAAIVEQAAAASFRRLLHLAGHDHVTLPVKATAVCYASAPVPIAADALLRLVGRTVLIHSARAARQLAALLDRSTVSRGRIVVAALSAAVLTAAGSGWEDTAVASQPSDAALVTCAIDRARSAADKDHGD